jgi:HAD superfamily hydrolase (TIGR01458 family)
MDGVLTISGRALPGAADAVAALRSGGRQLRIVTNTSSRSRAQIVGDLASAGIEIDDEELVTAVSAAADLLRRTMPGARAHLLGDAEAIRSDIDAVQWVDENASDVDVVVVTGADSSFAFDRLNKVVRMLVAGAALVAVHRGLTWMTADGLCMDAGGYLLGLEAATGVSATITGKPSPEFFAAALSSAGSAPADTVMIGDDLVNDVLAAQQLGIRGVLVRTGKFRQAQLDASATQPALVVESIAAVPEALGL